MANKDRALIYSIILYVGLCLYAYYYKKYELPLLPEPTNDIDWHIRGITYQLSFIFNLILALLFYLLLKIISFIGCRLKRHL